MVMTLVRPSAPTPAKKAASRKPDVRVRGVSAQQEDAVVVIVQPGVVRSRADVEHVFKSAIAEGGADVDRRLRDALSESKRRDTRIKRFSERRTVKK